MVSTDNCFPFKNAEVSCKYFGIAATPPIATFASTIVLFSTEICMAELTLAISKCVRFDTFQN